MAETYSQQNVYATFAGGLVVTGLGEGDDVITAERNTEKNTQTVGADGSVTYNEVANDTGMITVTLKQTSPTNGDFKDLYDSGEEFDFHIADNNPNSSDIDAYECKIENLPTKSNGESVAEREWNILVGDYNEN